MHDVAVALEDQRAGHGYDLPGLLQQEYFAVSRLYISAARGYAVRIQRVW